jgi:hypothetical protein
VGRLSRALRTGMLSLAVIASSLAIVPFAAAPASARDLLVHIHLNP